MTDQNQHHLGKYVGKQVVIDTATTYVYMGTLKAVENEHLILKEVDVHDTRTSKSTKEVYVMEAAEHGIRVNRKEATVPRRHLLSISRLDDVVQY